MKPADEARQCEVPGCGPSAGEFRRWCHKHARRAWKYGSPYFTKRLWPRKSKCQVESCPYVTYGRGYCEGHYRRLMRTGKLTNSFGEIEIDYKVPHEIFS